MLACCAKFFQKRVVCRGVICLNSLCIIIFLPTVVFVAVCILGMALEKSGAASFHSVASDCLLLDMKGWNSDSEFCVLFWSCLLRTPWASRVQEQFTSLALYNER